MNNTKKSLKVLFIGESWHIHMIHSKGYDSFTSSKYEEGATWLLQCLKNSQVDVTYMPAHTVQIAFPEDVAQLEQYDAIVISDIGSNTFLLQNDTFYQLRIKPNGLVVMFFIIMARKETRQQFAAIPSLIKNRKVPLWNWFAGLCGAMVVFSEGASASALGVATFQTALISALLLSGLLCDRFGIGVDEKKYFTPYRIIGALFAVIATIFVVSPQWHSTSFILLAILPFLAGLLAGWQPAGNAKVAEATGSMLVSIT